MPTAPEKNVPRPPQEKDRPKKKKDQLALAQYGDKLSSANRPDPDDPGGLGAEESGAERTGSTQEYLLAIQLGGRWAEVGQYYDSANDPVTAYFRRDSPARGGLAAGRILLWLTPASCSGGQSARSCG